MKLLQTALFILVSTTLWGQKFDDFSNFKIFDGVVVWQNTFPWEGLTKANIISEIKKLVAKNRRYLLLSGDNEPIILDVTGYPLMKEGYLYNAKLSIEVVDDGYRLTISSLKVKGRDPEGMLEKDRKHFKATNLDYLTTLNGQLIYAFDFQEYVKKP